MAEQGKGIHQVQQLNALPIFHPDHVHVGHRYPATRGRQGWWPGGRQQGTLQRPGVSTGHHRMERHPVILLDHPGDLEMEIGEGRPERHDHPLQVCNEIRLVRMLVTERGWSPEQFESWLAEI